MGNVKFEKAKKSLKGWGGTVIILAVLSLTGIEDADESLVAFAVFSIAICVIAGIWLALKPTVISGVSAGGSLILLTIVDGMLSAEGSGSAFYVLIDLFAVIMVFVSVVQFINASKTADEIDVSTEPGTSDQPEAQSTKITIGKDKAKAVVTLLDPGYLAGVVGIEFVVDGFILSNIQFGETREYEIEPGNHIAKVVLHGVITRTSKELPFSVEKGQTVNIEGKYSRAWGKINISLM